MSQMKRLLSLTQPTIDEVKRFRASVEGEKSATSIERLSNELFYDIFDYLDGCDIYHAFSNLNTRFQSLLDDPSLTLKIKLSVQSILEAHWKSIILPQRHRLLSLSFSDESILDRFLLHCTIDASFQRLQSLNLNSLPAYKCLTVLFDLISLPRLSSLTCSLTSCYLDVSYIYRIVFRFQSLTYFKLSLPVIEDLGDFEQAVFVAERQQLSHIEHFVMDHCCTLHDFVSIISFMPGLRHLTCQTLFEIDEHTGTEVLITAPNLTHIVIERCELRFDLFEVSMKKLCSQLQVLRVGIRLNDEQYLDGDRWEQLITQHMPHLQKFYLKYYEHLNDRRTWTPHHRLLDRFSSPFWTDRRWIIGLELEGNELIYSIQPHRYLSTTIFDNHAGQEDHAEKTVSISGQTIPLDIRYRCAGVWAESFNEYFISIFSLIRITYLDFDCNRAPLLTCLKLIGLLSDLKTLKLSSLSMTEAKRLSTEKWKTIHAVAYQNKISIVILDKMADFGEIQFLTILCPSMKYLQVSPVNEADLSLFVQFIQMKQNKNQITGLSTLCLHVRNGNDQMVHDLDHLVAKKSQWHNYTIKRIGNQINLRWNAHTCQT